MMAHGKIHLYHAHKKSNLKKTSEFIFKEWMYLIAILIPFTTIPQIVQIWKSRSAVDVSLITWIAFLISAISWLIYALKHKDKILILNCFLWIFFEIIVIIGIIKFG